MRLKSSRRAHTPPPQAPHPTPPRRTDLSELCFWALVFKSSEALFSGPRALSRPCFQALAHFLRPCLRASAQSRREARSGPRRGRRPALVARPGSQGRATAGRLIGRGWAGPQAQTMVRQGGETRPRRRDADENDGQDEKPSKTRGSRAREAIQNEMQSKGPRPARRDGGPLCGWGRAIPPHPPHPLSKRRHPSPDRVHDRAAVLLLSQLPPSGPPLRHDTHTTATLSVSVSVRPSVCLSVSLSFCLSPCTGRWRVPPSGTRPAPSAPPP